MNFNHLGLKKLICTCYAGSPIAQTEFSDLPLFHKDEKLPYMIEITEVPDMNGDGATDLSDIELLLKSNENVLTALDGDGDFRSEESAITRGGYCCYESAFFIIQRVYCSIDEV